MIRILIILFSVILVFLIGRLWIGSGSYPQIWDMRDKITTLSASSQDQQEAIRKLEAEIQQFQEGTEAIEARARSDFGMIKQGETFYQIILKPEQQSSKATPSGTPSPVEQQSENHEP